MINKNTKAIFAVHLLGQPSKIKEIKKLCEKNKLILIEDCCESVGAEVDEIKVGNFGKMGSFSFYFGHHMSVSPNTLIPFLNQKEQFGLKTIEEIYNNYKQDEIKIISFDENNETKFVKPSGIIQHKLDNKNILKFNFNEHWLTISQTVGLIARSISNYDRKTSSLAFDGYPHKNIVAGMIGLIRSGRYQDSFLGSQFFI